jgi:hypothetical protein
VYRRSSASASADVQRVGGEAGGRSVRTVLHRCWYSARERPPGVLRQYFWRITTILRLGSDPSRPPVTRGFHHPCREPIER